MNKNSIEKMYEIRRLIEQSLACVIVNTSVLVDFNKQY